MLFTAKILAAEFGNLRGWPSVVQEVSAEDILNRWIPIMASPMATARKLAGSAALVTGVAAGLAALLGAEGVMPGCPGNPRLLEAGEAAAAGDAAVKVGTVSWHDLQPVMFPRPECARLAPQAALPHASRGRATCSLPNRCKHNGTAPRDMGDGNVVVHRGLRPEAPHDHDSNLMLPPAANHIP